MAERGSESRRVGPGDWDALVAAAGEMLAARQRESLAAFGIDGTGQYHWDLDRAEIVFGRDGERLALATIHCVGGVAQSSGTWLWSWANDAVPEPASRPMLEVREYGRAHGFARLVEPEWPAEPAVGYELAAVAGAVIGADGFFHDHAGDLSLWFVLTDFRKPESPGRHPIG